MSAPALGERTPTPAAIELRSLSKAFGGRSAVADLNLTVPTGSFFGLVGPNGAGKTTTLSMVSGLLRPDSGRVEICGVDVWGQLPKIKGLIGLVPDGLRVFDRLSGPELLTFCGRLRSMDPRLVAERSEQLLAVLGLSTAGRTQVIDYSTGMRKKITLATALLHDPQVLILDEPFEGVDPVSSKTIHGVLQQYVARGRTVVCSSHAMDVVQRLCDHVAVMAAGSVRASGTIDSVRGDGSLEAAFFRLIGEEHQHQEGLSWLGSSSN